jgi:hypothetical protein
MAQFWVGWLVETRKQLFTASINFGWGTHVGQKQVEFVLKAEITLLYFCLNLIFKLKKLLALKKN